MVVHPSPGNYTGTLVNALLYHCQLPAMQVVLGNALPSQSLTPSGKHEHTLQELRPSEFLNLKENPPQQNLQKSHSRNFLKFSDRARFQGAKRLTRTSL